MWAIGESGVSLSAVLMCYSASAGLRAVGQAADHRADLADDLGVVQRQRGVRFGVLGRQFQRGVQRVAHLAGDALLQRLGDAQALAVAAQREGVAVVAVGFVGQRLDRGFGQLGGLFEALELLGVVVDQIGRVDADGLDRDRRADRAERFAGVERGLEIAAMEGAPGVLQCASPVRRRRALRRGLAGGLDQRGGALGVGEGFAVAGVQLAARPSSAHRRRRRSLWRRAEMRPTSILPPCRDPLDGISMAGSMARVAMRASPDRTGSGVFGLGAGPLHRLLIVCFLSIAAVSTAQTGQRSRYSGAPMAAKKKPNPSPRNHSASPVARRSRRGRRRPPRA